MTEYFTRRILRKERQKWTGSGPNPYSDAEYREHPYYGLSFVTLGVIMAAHPGRPSDDIVVDYSYNPHKLTRLTQVLTGSHTEERKAALAEVLDRLFDEARQRAASPYDIETEIPIICKREIQEFCARFAS